MKDRLNHKGTIKIETNRLLLRQFKADDAETMYYSWAKDPEVTKYLSWASHTSMAITKEIIKSWVNSYYRKDFYLWAIEYKKTGRVIGSISSENILENFLRCDVGYCLSREFWNQGVATEALQNIIRFLITSIGFKRVQAVHHLENHASGKVMLKSGMKFEGVIRSYLLDNKEFLRDCKLYAITDKDL